MQQLTNRQVKEVSGGDYNLVFVSVNLPSPNIPPSVANLISSLMMGHMDPGSFAQAMNEVGGNLVQFMTVSPTCPPMMPNCMPPNPPPMFP